MRNLWQLFQGYGEVELKGMGLERALTQLERAGVTLWHIRRVDRLTITCRVPMHQKRLFRKTAAELPCHIAWRRERGLPGFAHRLLQRRLQHRMDASHEGVGQGFVVMLRPALHPAVPL